MRVRVKNNSEAPYGVEKASGGYLFIAPGKTREVDAEAPGRLYQLEFLEVEAVETGVPEMPESLAQKVTAKPSVARNALDQDGDGKSGGSVKGYHSTAAKGARRRRRKAASK